MAEREELKVTACCGGKNNRDSEAFMIANNFVVEE